MRVRLATAASTDRLPIRGVWQSYACGLLLCCAGTAQADSTPPSALSLPQVVQTVDAGRFADAEVAIGTALARSDLSLLDRDALAFERERMRRIRLDFHLDPAEAQARVRKQIPDLDPAEFARWDQAGLIEHFDIDGTRWYFDRAVSNLFLLSPEAEARRAVPSKPIDGPMEILNPHHAQVRREALALGKPGVAPRRVRVRYSLDVDADAVPAGKTVRAWLPYPRAIPGQQEGLRLITTEPNAHQLAPESTLQRTVYLEKVAEAGKPTEFAIEYELSVLGQFHAINESEVLPAPASPELTQFLVERAPHVVFTDELRAFSRRVVGEERNPYRIAQKLFAAVDRIPWAGAREYSTISNISDYALHAGHADCGQQTLLLISLLRLNGIPARWQSGWVFSEGSYDNMHDWGWLYLAPYGWVPMDVTFGRFQTSEPGMEWFYLGGLDSYRIAFNDDYSRDFVPAKRHVRSETVDLQRGEVEWDGGNLYFDQWNYSFNFQVLSATSSNK